MEHNSIERAFNISLHSANDSAVQAREAVDETLELDAAVQTALQLVDLSETLIIVTADHSHALTINGYPDRGADMFGLAGHGSDHLYYSSLMYGTGPGYKQPAEDGSRYDIRQTSDNLITLK